MGMREAIHLNVIVMESDVYARNAIASYFAWDRRTRVIARPDGLETLYLYLKKHNPLEKLDTILLDDKVFPTPESLHTAMQTIRQYTQARVLLLALQPNLAIAQAARASGMRGYVIREDVGLQITWMVVWERQFEFIVSPRSAHLFPEAPVLPDARTYPELTDRVRQALLLCVVEGMSAELAADEMGLSPHTIRTYIKEGYSILEASDQTEYPIELSPQERAFMRLTAFSLDAIDRKLDDQKKRS